MHGKEATELQINMFLEVLIDTYKYETPETILLFLHKAAKGDYGKFFGNPDIGTIRQWFAQYLENVIVPERERVQRSGKEIYDNQREQAKSLREHLQSIK